MKNANNPAPKPDAGEGDYESAKRYQKDAADFAHSGKVDKAAQDAKKAREGDERPELDRAEDEGRSRAKEPDR
jgi:hypothetical protein